MNNNYIILKDAMVKHCEESNIPFTIAPENKSYLKCQYHEVLFAQLPEKPERSIIHEFLENELQKALTLWKTATQANANDIYLFFIGSDDSFADKQWLSIASEIERDERLCRKLVWLPSSQNTAEQFLRRTFLAHPWVEGETKNVDALSVLEEELEISNSWLDLLQDSNLERYDLLLKLIASMDDNNL